MRDFEAARRKAEKQAGAISRSQLLELGFSSAAITRATADNWLVPIYRGVYRVALATQTQELRLWGAILRAGEGAVLSHVSAGRLWKLDGLARTLSPVIDITIPEARTVTPVRNICVHRSRTLVPVKDFGLLRGVPCTSLTRTVVDLASVLGAIDLEVAFDSALRRSPEQRQSIIDALDRLGWRPGGTNLQAIATAPDLGNTGSALESRVRAILRKAQIRLPVPQLQICDAFGDQIGVFDFAWPEKQVVVVCDSWQHHQGREVFEKDRRQWAALQAIGWNVIPVTSRRLDEDTAGFVGEVVSLLR